MRKSNLLNVKFPIFRNPHKWKATLFRNELFSQESPKIYHTIKLLGYLTVSLYWQNGEFALVQNGTINIHNLSAALIIVCKYYLRLRWLIGRRSFGHFVTLCARSRIFLFLIYLSKRDNDRNSLVSVAREARPSNRFGANPYNLEQIVGKKINTRKHLVNAAIS